MSSTASAKRMKLVKENEFKNSIIKAESGFHSEIDLSSNTTTDFSLPAVKRKSLAPRRASLQQISLNLTSENTQQSSGYSSLYSSSSSTSNITTTGSTSSLIAGRISRTPKKRKSEVTESDENFYNSFQFVSPVKIRRRDVDDKNCAKLVLKEKCSSENVILCSTPIRTQNTKWGKFRSFHPEKITSGKILDSEEVTEKIICTPPIKSLAEEDSINLSNIDFSNLSGNFTNNSNLQQDIPANLHNLWTDDIKQSNSVSTPSESQVKSVQSSTFSSSSINSSKSSIDRRHFFNGRTKFDILGSLHTNNDIAVKEILSFLDAASLVNLSHVCKDYNNMIKDNKQYNTKRLNYLKKCRAIKENKVPPSKRKALNFTIATENNLNESSIRDKKKKKAFGSYNINLSLTKQKTPSPPQSPSSRRFNEIQKLIQSNKTSTFKRCPRCRKPATINTVKIRNSPRKKKASSSSSNILKLSTSTGHVQKRFRSTFLSKTSIPESFHETLTNPHYVTLSHIDEDSSRSPQRSSSCESPNSSGTEESCEMDEIYEYGICTGVGCSFKFCIKCNCKYHPRRICGDLSPPSPSRNSNNNSKILAGTKASRKSLRRLNY